MSPRTETRPIQHDYVDQNSEPARARKFVGQGNLRTAGSLPPAPGRELISTVDAAKAADENAKQAFAKFEQGRARLTVLYIDFPDKGGLDDSASAVEGLKRDALNAARLSVTAWRQCKDPVKISQAQGFLDQVNATPVPTRASAASVTDNDVKQRLDQLHRTKYKDLVVLNSDVGQVRNAAIRNLTAWRHVDATNGSGRAGIEAGLKRAQHYIGELNEFRDLTSRNIKPGH